MKYPLSARIAWRYLRAKKSHSAVGAISVVSICGIAVATAAIICVLSVFNGFKSVIGERIDTLTPDVMVTPATGKVFADGDSLAEAIRQVPGVEIALPSLFDNALALAEGREAPVMLKGVDTRQYARVTSLNSLIIDSVELPKPTAAENTADDDDEDDFRDRTAILAVGTAGRLALNPGGRMLLFTPRREGRVNLANPAASFLRDSVTVEKVYQSNQSQFDDNRVIVDIELARDLLQYDLEASAVEIKAAPGVSPEALAQAISQKLNNSSSPDKAKYIVKDRLQQQEMNFRMISIEKWVTFLLLFFILLIASFNIISSLSMLVIEKERSMSTLRALGMTRGRIASVFRWESIYVSLIGGLSGIAIGLGLCLLQEKFGLIKLQGDPSQLVVAAYPVAVDPLDIVITLVPLIVIGTLTAIITGAFARSRCD